MRLSQPKGVEIKWRFCIIYVGDRYEVRSYKGEVSIALVSILAITPLAVIYTIAYIYGKWLRVGCLIGWPRLSGCIWGIYSFGGVYFLRGRAVIQFSRIFASFTAYISLLISSTSFTVS